MKLNQLLDSIRYGEQVVEEMTDKEHIISCLDEDTNHLLVSQRLNDFIAVLSEGVEEKCDRSQLLARGLALRNQLG